MQHYLATTIGPIYKTILQARATREIWAASFIFSMLMKELLKVVEQHPKKEKILTPDISAINSTTTYHGAGVYPDRCQVLLKEKLSAAEIEAIRQEVYQNLLGGIPAKWQDYFHLYFVQATYSQDESINITHRLNQLLDNIELQQKFIPQGTIDIIGKLIEKRQVLFLLGMESNDSIFISNTQGNRLPSLVEICTRNLKEHANYANYVTQPIWKNIQKKRTTVREKDMMLQQLKGSLEEDTFKMYHKYYAIVQSDGDGIGAVISQIEGNDSEKLIAFSKQLMSFSQEAAKTIANYGAIPVYIGGDDLLFIAPLINENGETIFDCIAAIENNFKIEGASLSFGMAISYYKYPMGKILQTSYDQLFKAAKELKFKEGSGQKNKDAIAFQLRKHSGQSFGTMLPKGSEAYEHFTEMIKKYVQLDHAALSTIIYHLKERQYLLVASLASGDSEYFFEHNFNEIPHSMNEFIKEVRELVEKIYSTYSSIKVTPAWQQYLSPDETPSTESITANTLYSCLRLIHFLNAKDHE